VVFGGTGALGRAVVNRAVEDLGTVVVADRTTPTGSDRRQDVTYATVDALEEQEVASFFASLDTPWAVVNLIGGYTTGQALVDLDVAVLRRQLELNLVSAALITKYAVARIATGGAGGRLIHTSSRVATEDGRDGFAYSVSKLAVVRLVEAAAAEVLDDGITVNCIMPSIIDTPANRASMPSADHARWPKPEQIAAVLSFLMSDDAELVSAAAIPVYGRA